MIISQEKAFLKAQTQLQEICRFVEQAASDGGRIDQAERQLFAELLAVGLTLLEAFVAAQGDGDVGKELEHGGHRLQRLKGLHTRRYLSIFGELFIKRRVYVQRWRPDLLALFKAFPPGSDTHVPRKSEMPLDQLGRRPSY